MSTQSMVTVGGYRYRVEDAVRLGLIVSPTSEVVPGKVGVAPANKRRKAPANKGVAKNGDTAS